MIISNVYIFCQGGCHHKQIKACTVTLTNVGKGVQGKSL